MAKRNRKVLVVSTSMMPPSVLMRGSKTVYALQKQLRDLGYEVHILTHISRRQNRSYDDWVKEQEKQYGVFFHCFEISGLRRFDFLYHVVCSAMYIYWVWVLHRKYNFDIAHDYVSAPILFLRAFFYKLFGVESVLCTLVTYNTSLYASSRLGFGIRYVDVVIGVTKDMVSGLSGRYFDYSDRITFLPLGVVFVDGKTVHRRRDDNVVVTYVGHLDSGKGVEVLVSALIDLKKDVRDKVLFRLVTYGGEGEVREDTWGIEKKLRRKVDYEILTGIQPVEKVLAHSDIVVLPYSTLHGTMGYPATLVESLMAGKAVITTDFAALRELVSDGETGLVVKANDVLGLRRAIRKLVDRKDLRDRLGKSARKFISKQSCFSQAEVAKEIDKLYRNLKIE